jgi:hypothetical protein
MNRLYYGEFDSGFIRAIESLIEYENSKKAGLKTKAENPDIK